MNQSAVMTDTKINIYSLRFKAYKTHCILYSDVLLQALKSVFFELNHLNKSTVLMTLSWRQWLYQKEESDKDDINDRIESENNLIVLFNMWFYQAHTTAEMIHKCKCIIQNSLLYSFTFIFTALFTNSCSLKHTQYKISVIEVSLT